MDSQLNENQRKQLDGIVAEMTANNEPDNAIQFVVNDFKQKYSTPIIQPEKDGFIKSMAKDVVNTLVTKPAIRFGQVLAAPIVSTFGNEEQKKRYKQAVAEPTPTPFGNIEGQKAFGEGGGKQILGEGLKTGTYLASGGSGGLASRFGLTGLKKVGAMATENALLSGAYQTGSNLVEDKPAFENVGTATALGAVLPVAGVGLVKAKQAILNRAMPEAERVINSLIKPLSKDFAYGKNPARGILNEGIVANNFDDLVKQVNEKSSLVGEGIGAVGQKLDQSGVTLNLTPALTPIDSAIQSAAKNNNQTLFQNLNNVKTALMHDLSVGVDENGVPAIVKGGQKNLIGASYNNAKDFLSDIASHTKFTGNPSDDKALNMATKQAYGIAREIMNKSADSVDPVLGKQIRNLNERYADLLSAKNAISHRDIVMKRQNILNLADRFSIPVAVASSLGTAIITQDFAKAGLMLAGELASIGAIKGLGSTAAKTRIAQFLSRLAPEERQGILNSTPVIKNFYERLTGQTSPGENAPKTKALQATQDYLKNPKAGLSIEAIKETPKNFAQLNLDDQKFLSNYAQKVKDGKGALPSDTQIVKDTFKNYGLNVPEDPKQIASQIELMKQGLDEAIINQVATKPVQSIDSNLLQEAKKYKTPEEFVKAKGTPVYHGTGETFDTFDTSKLGSITGAKSAKGALWFTDDQATAKAYSIYAAEEGPVKKALDEANRLEKIAQKSGKQSDWAKHDEMVVESERLAEYENTFNRRKGANVMDVTLPKDLKIKVLDAKGKSPQELSSEGDIDSWLDLQVTQAKKAGYDGLKIKNLDDAVGLYDRPATHYAIFDPKKVQTKSQLTDIWNKANGKSNKK
jgi:hypothetical protein